MAFVATTTLIEACEDPTAMKGCEIMKAVLGATTPNASVLRSIMSSMEKLGCTKPGIMSEDKGTFKQGISE